MSEVKRYHVTEAGLVEGKALGRINVVLGADHDRVTAERDAERRRADVAVADANAADAAGKKVSELLSNRTAERDALQTLQTLLTAADERADALGSLVPEAELALKALNVAVSVYDVELADSARRGLRLIIAALKPAEGGGDE